MGTFRILYSVVAQCFSKHLPQMRMAWTAASTIHRSVLLHIRCGKIRSGWSSKCVRGCVRQRKGCHIFAVIRFMINISAATLVSLLVDFLPLLGIVIIQLVSLANIHKPAPLILYSGVKTSPSSSLFPNKRNPKKESQLPFNRYQKMQFC